MRVCVSRFVHHHFGGGVGQQCRRARLRLVGSGRGPGTAVVRHHAGPVYCVHLVGRSRWCRGQHVVGLWCEPVPRRHHVGLEWPGPRECRRGHAFVLPSAIDRQQPDGHVFVVCRDVVADTKRESRSDCIHVPGQWRAGAGDDVWPQRCLVHILLLCVPDDLLTRTCLCSVGDFSFLSFVLLSFLRFFI